VNIDASLVLLVVPAAGEFFTAELATLARKRKARHQVARVNKAAVVPALLLLYLDNLPHTDVAVLWQMLPAAGANTLLVKGGIAARARHAELHGTRLVCPLLLLT
jgi:hypothetical protein